jgi:hypothetical protein
MAKVVVMTCNGSLQYASTQRGRLVVVEVTVMMMTTIAE